ncbi:MAG TPA: transglutaminase-like domain-containing protein [Anaeromyxobacteraceae bacterium]|nr:transglutaminase-like domain-containing protein [Anaeromyxobacteraceae bacterium]
MTRRAPSILAAAALAAALLAPGGAGAKAPGTAADRARCRPAATIADVAPRPVPEWYALYLNGKKVGWIEGRSTGETRDGKAVRVYRQEMLVEAVVGPRTVQRRAREERVYEARKGGRLLSMSTAFGGDGGDRTVRVDCGPRTCTARITAADGNRTTEIPHPGEAIEQADATRLAALTCGSVSGPQLQAEDLRVKRMTDRFTGRSTAGGGGVEVPVSVVEQSEDGDRTASRVLVADDGRLLETRIGDGMVIRLEPEETARRLDLVDLFTMLRVPLPGPLPRDVPMAITYGLRGVPQGFDLRDERQSVAAGPGGEVVLTVTARPPSGPDVPRGKPAAKGDPDQAATIDVDWDHPSIRTLAEATVAGTTGTWAAARKINAEVYRRLDKVYGQSRDRASEILALGKGDCTEHTRLFVALARASGIRAREVKGLVYASYGQGGPGLYWHAWPEVKVGDAWVAMDPTFGQDVADATHVALGRGSRQDAVALVGSLSVTRAESRKP